MIAYLSGKVLKIEEKDVIVLAGNVGYRVAITEHLRHTLTLEGDAHMWTYLAVREDAMDLYGFADENEQQLFLSLLKVSGIGPKSAMGILSGTGAEILRRAISGNDPAYLTKVAGVGKKTAEKIVLELRDKVHATPGAETGVTAESEALDALEALGYSVRDTRDIVRVIASTENDAGTIVRQALKQLGK